MVITLVHVLRKTWVPSGSFFISGDDLVTVYAAGDGNLENLWEMYALDTGP